MYVSTTSTAVSFIATSEVHMSAATCKSCSSRPACGFRVTGALLPLRSAAVRGTGKLFLTHPIGTSLRPTQGRCGHSEAERPAAARRGTVRDWLLPMEDLSIPLSSSFRPRRRADSVVPLPRVRCSVYLVCARLRLPRLCAAPSTSVFPLPRVCTALST